jgi:hypothetical protein
LHEGAGLAGDVSQAEAGGSGEGVVAKNQPMVRAGDEDALGEFRQSFEKAIEHAGTRMDRSRHSWVDPICEAAGQTACPKITVAQMGGRVKPGCPLGLRAAARGEFFKLGAAESQEVVLF